jgi:hypothetical protein
MARAPRLFQVRRSAGRYGSDGRAAINARNPARRSNVVSARLRPRGRWFRDRYDPSTGEVRLNQRVAGSISAAPTK